MDGHETGENRLRSTDWKDIAELIGVSAIVASLVFVGLQMKQSQEIAVATQYQERTAITLESIAARSQVPNMAETIGARIRDDFERYYFDEISNSEIGHRWFAARLALATFDNGHFQWQAGYLDDEGWEMQRRTLDYFCVVNLWADSLLRNEIYTGNLFQPFVVS